MTVTQTVRSTASAVRIMPLSAKKVSIPGPASASGRRRSHAPPLSSLKTSNTQPLRGLDFTNTRAISYYLCFTKMN